MNNVTEKQIEKFFSTLADTLNVTVSAKAAKFDRTTAYAWKRKNPEFKKRWDEVIESSLDDLELSTLNRAKDSSDTLAIFLLKTRRREIYGQEQERFNATESAAKVMVIMQNADEADGIPDEE